VRSPIWKQVFDATERRASPVLERTVNSRPLAYALTFGMAWQRRLNDLTEQHFRRLLHAWNMPAGTDVRRMSDQITSLERRVRDLAKHVEELGGTDSHAQTHGRY
jgi:hypothetical protein